ncbi:MAG: hypothetical protein HKP10_05865 [Kiritimatiellales bacterium]|nr:hypothetical protein [Pontiella sp.]NNJ70799.1 hypothetical protein [Kiritimatiellales bacterium]
MRTIYDYRVQGDDEDHDGYAYWRVGARNMASGHVDVYTSGRAHDDLDGSAPSGGGDPFLGLQDTSRRDEIRLLQFYMELHDAKNKMALRIGRQYADVADYIHMDGAQAILYERGRLGGRLFAGQPVSFYSSTSGDLFAGASLVGRPWKGNRSRMTYARYEDDDRAVADDHCFIDVRQQVSDAFRARGYLSVMNDDVRMSGGDVYYTSRGDEVFSVRAGIRRWGTYDAQTRVYSPLLQTLGGQEPYTTAYGRFTRELLPWLHLAPGIYIRYPDADNSSNRRYERYNLGLIFRPEDALKANIGLEYWDVEDGGRFSGLSGQVEYEHRKLWEIAAGAAYLDYTYYRFSDFSVSADGGGIVAVEDGTRTEISPDTFTYFVRGKWNVSRNLALRLSGEVEDDSEEADLGYRVRATVEVRM